MTMLGKELIKGMTEAVAHAKGDKTGARERIVEAVRNSIAFACREEVWVVYAMFDGATFSVKFKDMKIMKVKNIEKDARRVGRLLPPFLTRVQQRYAAYLQRPGLPRIPAAMHVAEKAA